VLFGDFVIPVISAILAALFTFENSHKRFLSYFVSLVLVVLNIAALVFVDGYCSFFGFFAVLFAAIIYISFTHGVSKADCVFALTAAGSILVALTFVYFAMTFTNNYTLSAVADFVALFREAFVRFMDESVNSVIAAMPESKEQLSALISNAGTVFDSFKMTSPSFAVMVGFVLCGVALKIYSFLVFKMSDLGHSVFDWKFKTSKIFAYFYVVLSLVSIFTLSASSIFSVAVTNLYNIFTVVYAYFGFNLAVNLLSARRSKGFAFILLIIAILALSSFAIEILSLMGVFYCITDNKRQGDKA
jgi:hypothetical protein